MIQTDLKGAVTRLQRRGHVELFSIQCTTCHSRLKVRDVAAIGQILGCPKCGSMVQVEAPTGFKPPVLEKTVASTVVGKPKPAYDSRADTKPFDDLEGEFGEENDESAAEPNRALTDLDETTRPEARSSDEENSQADVDQSFRETDAETPPAEQEPILPNADWSSHESQQLRRWLLLGGVSVGGVILAVGTIGFLAARASTNTDAEQKAAQLPQDEPRKSSDQAPQTPTPGVEPDRLTAEPQEQPASEPKTLPSLPETAPLEPVEPGSPPPPEDPVAPQLPPPEEPGGLSPRDEVEKDATRLSSSLRTLEELLNPGAAPISELGGPTSEDPRAEEGGFRPPAEVLPRPKQRNVDVDVQLKKQIRGIEFENVALIDFLRFVGEMSTIPITLDPDALLQTSVKPDSPVSANRTDVTVAQLLEDVLAPLGLRADKHEGHLIVSNAAPDAVATQSIDVKDLTGGDAKQLQKLGQIVTSCVAPGSWQVKGGAGKLVYKAQSLQIQNTTDTVFRSQVLLDRLRTARGKPTRSGLDERLLRTDAAPEAGFLATKVTANFREPTYFTEMLEHLSNESGAEIIVDWVAITEAGWNPNAILTLSVDDQTLSDALRTLLTPMELAYRVVDERIVQVTIPTLVDGALTVALYSLEGVLSEDTDAATFLALLKTQVGEALFQEHGGPGAMFIDAPSKRLIVALPHYRQPVVAGLLTKLRDK